MTPNRPDGAQPQMSFPAPQPVVFAPQFHVKPWGGRRLADLFNKPLPPDEPIGESWELSGLPGHESRVARGPLAGRTIQELLDAWGRDLLGRAASCHGRFPLLLKYLDARENLSVQVHPKPIGAGDRTYERTSERGNVAAAEGELENAAGLSIPTSPPSHLPTPAVKHEAWYIVAADPGAVVYIGLRPGITSADLAAALATQNGSSELRSELAAPSLVSLLQQFAATPGRCFYLPSGTLHALGAGVVVAEIQTPSDVTYRLYDWDRRDSAGRPRELHIEQALANIRYDIAPSEILQGQPAGQPPAEISPHSAPPAAPFPSSLRPSVPSSPRPSVPSSLRPSVPSSLRLCSCDRFTIAHRTLNPGQSVALDPGRMTIWMILSGRGELIPAGPGRPGNPRLSFEPGDTLLIPAASSGWSAVCPTGCALLEIHAAD